MSGKTFMEDIETAKENILPIRQGRRADVMSSVLRNKDDQTQHERRSYFENELRSYTGDDPLKIWLEYISWVEQNFITGGKDFNIVELIKKCLLALKDKEIYKNDQRILAVWLKFANASADPLEVFNYMAPNGICCMLAHFYVEWAWKLEAVGNLKAANAILQDGINIGAQPIEALQRAICQLDLMSVKAIRESFEAVPTEAEERHAFNKLKPQGKKHAAPVLRVGDYVQERERAHLVENVQQKPKLSRPFNILQDDESCTVPKKTQMPSKSAPSYIFHPEVNKENFRKAEKWTDVKASKWIPSRPAGTHELGFTVHCDEDQEPEASIPKKPVTVGVLSAKKEATCSPPVALFEESDPNKMPMYDKVKVYCGGTEYSFEEIHAAILYHEQGEDKDSEGWFLGLQKTTQGLEEDCAISQESDGEERREHHIENVCEDANVETLCSNSKLSERSTPHVYQLSPEKVVEELYAPVTGSHCLGADYLSHSQSYTPYDGMDADILDMIQNLGIEAMMNEHCHISNNAGAVYTEKAESVSHHKIEPVPDSVGVEPQENLGSQQPFQIYCDVTEEVAPINLKSNIDVLRIPGGQNVHDVENVPPPDYYSKAQIGMHKDLVSSPGSAVAEGVCIESQPSSSDSSPREKRADHEPDEQSSFVQNYTIVPPPDTAHFMLNAFVASTPHAKAWPSSSSCSSDTSPLSSYHRMEGKASQIPRFSHTASGKAEVQSKEVTKEGLLASSLHGVGTVSVKTFDLRRTDELR